MPAPKTAALTVALGLVAAGCATAPEPEGPLRPETVLAVTASHELIRFNAGQPTRITERKPLLGLPVGDSLVGIDFRVSRGVLYALSRSGRLFTVDTASGQLKPVGSGAPIAVPLAGTRFGFDFNPAADRIRVVSNIGQNLRLHPDTGAVVDGDPAAEGVQGDPALDYAPGDLHAGRAPQLAGAAYTYNQKDEKLTTNYAVDIGLGLLVMQGSREGVQPVVSPNSGRLSSIGPLGTGPLTDVAFDISDVRNEAFVAVRTAAQPQTRLLRLDLASGRATPLGTVGRGEALLGLAVEP